MNLEPTQEYVSQRIVFKSITKIIIELITVNFLIITDVYAE